MAFGEYKGEGLKQMSRRQRIEAMVHKGQAFRGTIEQCVLPKGTGLLILHIKDAKGVTWPVYGQPGPTVHLLNSVFGGVIAEGHVVNVLPFIGREVYYEIDDLLGTLVSLIETSDPELD